MNISKPKVIGPVRAVCPVCRTTAYSRGGIHPQCAVLKADKAVRNVRSKAPETKPPAARQQWVKRCPKCRRELHVRRAVCDCGHSFLPKTKT
jgi:hypothetical protein